MKRGKFDTYDALFSHLLNYFTLGLNFNVGHSIKDREGAKINITLHNKMQSRNNTFQNTFPLTDARNN